METRRKKVEGRGKEKWRQGEKRLEGEEKEGDGRGKGEITNFTF